MKINCREWRKSYRKLFPWNTAQLQLFDVVSSWDLPLLSAGQEAVRVRAVAGAGKTSSIFGVIAALPPKYKIAVLAFNVHIAKKIKDDPRVPKGRVSVSTAHSFGLGLLRSGCYGDDLKVEKKKYRNLVDNAVIQELFVMQAEFIRDRDVLDKKSFDVKWLFPPPFYDERSKIGKSQFNGFKTLIVNICSMVRKSLCDLTFDEMLKMVNYYGLATGFGENEVIYSVVLAMKSLEVGLEIFDNFRVVDFEDMLYLPWKLGINPPKKDCIIVDEAQDANSAMLALYAGYVRQGAKIVYVGDDRQAIMGFAGAGVDSWEKLVQQFGGVEINLNISYRCPASHVAIASKVVNCIEADPFRSDEGTVGVLSLGDAIAKARLGDLFICRVSSCLIGVCLRLIKNGVKSRIRGKDISVNLIALASRAVGKSKDFWPLQFMDKVRFYVSGQVEVLKADEADEAIERLRDMQYCLQYFYQEIAAECGTFDVFCERIKRYFVGDKESLVDNSQLSEGGRSDYLVLSTIHRAKGDEAKRVFVLGSNLLPFYHPKQSDWQREQEQNILYVALTRAKEELYFVPVNLYNLDDVQSVSVALKQPYGGIGLK